MATLRYPQDPHRTPIGPCTLNLQELASRPVAQGCMPNACLRRQGMCNKSPKKVIHGACTRETLPGAGRPHDSNTAALGNRPGAMRKAASRFLGVLSQTGRKPHNQRWPQVEEPYCPGYGK